MTHGPGYQRLVGEARPRVRQVSVEEFLTWLQAGERYILIDVREDSEWALGHLPGAHHIARGILERDIEQAIPERDAPILLYCGGDHRGTLAADGLQQLGYTAVVSLEGGWRAWTERGLPVVAPQYAE